jgi:hypothetical protein
MQMMFSGFGSGARSFTLASGLPLPFLAAAASFGFHLLHFSITSRITSCGPSALMPFTTPDTSTILSPLTTPSL